MNVTSRILALAVLLSTLGCATPQWAYEARLDDASGLTIATLAEPITLARAAPRISQAARDYVYLGPVQVNRMGAREHYLWLGVASTVDRTPLGEQPLLPTHIVFVADGLPMPLTLEEWDSTLTGSTPYSVANTPYRSLGSRVTQQQLAVLANAKQVRVYLQSSDMPSARYHRWTGQFSDWSKSSEVVAAN